MRFKLSSHQIWSVRSRLQRYLACARGVTAIEFAFVAPMVLAIMLASIQISTIYVAQSYLDSVSESAMRIVLTNGAYTLTPAQFQTQLCQNVTALFNCNNLVVDLQPVTCTGTYGQITTCMNGLQPQMNASGAWTTTPSFTTGGTNSTMRLLVMYKFPVISGPYGLGFTSYSDGTRLLSSVQIFKKEPCLDLATLCASSNG